MSFQQEETSSTTRLVGGAARAGSFIKVSELVIKATGELVNVIFMGKLLDIH